MTARSRAVATMVATLALTSACSGGNGSEAGSPGVAPSRVDISATVSPGIATDPEDADLKERRDELQQVDDKAHALAQAVSDVPTSDDFALIGGFVRLAVEPSEVTASRLPLSRTVQLGVGNSLSDDVARADAGRPDAWVLGLPSLGGIIGPFSALDRIRRHVEMAGSKTIGKPGGAFNVSVGQHLRCNAGQPIADPPGIVVSRRVSLQPSNNSLASCLDWFSVDLFLDESGDIEAVLLDVWEP